jgi:hypothetical protein
MDALGSRSGLFLSHVLYFCSNFCPTSIEYIFELFSIADMFVFEHSDEEKPNNIFISSQAKNKQLSYSLPAVQRIFAVSPNPFSPIWCKSRKIAPRLESGLPDGLFSNQKT